MTAVRTARSVLVDGAPVARVEGEVIAVACDDDGHSLVLARVDGEAPRLWRWSHGDGALTLALDAAPAGERYVLAPRGRRVFAYSRDAYAVAWRGADGREGTVAPHGFRIVNVACSLDGRRLALVCDREYDSHAGAWLTGRGRVVDVDDGGALFEWQGSPACAFTDDGGAVVTVAPEMHSLLVTPLDGASPWRVPLGGVVEPRALVAERGGRRVALVAAPCEVLVCDLDGARVTTRFWADDAATLVGFAAGRLVFREREGGRVRRVVRDVAAGTEEALPGDADHLGALTPDGAWAVRHPAPLLELVSASGGEVRRFHDGHEAPVTCLAWSADGALLATLASGGAARVWDVERRELLWELEDGARVASALAFSPDRRLLHAAGAGNLLAWDMASGVEAHRASRFGRFALPSGASPRLAVSPDGARLATNAVEGYFALFANVPDAPRVAATLGSAEGDAGFDELGWCRCVTRPYSGYAWVARGYDPAGRQTSEARVGEVRCASLAIVEDLPGAAVALLDGDLLRLDLRAEEAAVPLTAGAALRRVVAARAGVAVVERADGSLAAVGVDDGRERAVVPLARRLALGALGPAAARLAVAYRDGGVEVFELGG